MKILKFFFSLSIIFPSKKCDLILLCVVLACFPFSEFFLLLYFTLLFPSIIHNLAGFIGYFNV